MKNSHGYHSTWMIPTLGSVFVLAAGCSSGSGPEPAPTASASYENLTTDLSICQKSHQTCLDAADGDRAKSQECRDELIGCGQAVQAARTEVHAALRVCVDAARSCVHGIGDGGIVALRACDRQFHSCVQAALPPPPPLPPCVEALRGCLETSEDGGMTAREQCFMQFRTCAEARLPPCMHGLATCIDDGGSFWGCERAVEACRSFRLAHDGGLPPTR